MLKDMLCEFVDPCGACASTCVFVRACVFVCVCVCARVRVRVRVCVCVWRMRMVCGCGVEWCGAVAAEGQMSSA